MDTLNDDAFDKATQHLERIAELKEKKLIEDTEYQELRDQAVSHLKRVLAPKDEQDKEQPTVNPALVPIPYGQLHAQIVATILTGYESPTSSPRERMLRLLGELAAKGALYEGDSVEMQKLIDSMCATINTNVLLDDAKGEAARILLQLLKEASDTSTRVNARNSSPVAKAIAEIAQQSASKAVEESDKQRADPNKQKTPVWKFWNKFVLKDLEGGFQGGLAGANAHAMFSASVHWSVPVFAAFGAVISAGVRSGVAYCEDASE